MSKHDEFFDEELVGLGVKFTDETAPKEMPKMERPGSDAKKADSSVGCGNSPSRAPSPTERAADAKYAHVPKYAPNLFDRLKGCAKWAVTFGSLSMLIFYWQQTGLMDPAAAVPSMCACTCLAGFGVGKHALW